MDTRWFRRFGEPLPAACRLICFPHAGGSATAYAPLSRKLSGTLDVLAVQYPARQDRRAEPPADGILRLAARIAEALTPYTRQPYAFFGHSMGRSSPTRPRGCSTTDPCRHPCACSCPGAAPGPTPDPHDRLPDDAAILAAVRKLGGTDASVLDDPELLDMVLPALRADYGALASYRWQPGPALNTPVTVLVGDADPVVPVASVAGWARQTRQDDEVLVFAGGHFYLSERLDQVTAVLRSRLSPSTGGSSGIPGSGPVGGVGGGAQAGPRGTQAAGGAGAAPAAGEPGGGDQRTAGSAVA
ncbi:thioesterase domain-containing protein [Streptomyces diastatochromogenes]|nr:thioesterase domain-containing protein [Streptomyces diastatochromogenes]